MLSSAIEPLELRETAQMKLSIVIICWNDWKVIADCLSSIFEQTKQISFEVIVSDNGSTDGSRENIRRDFPKAQIVENGANLGFAKGNNAGIRVAQGEYVLILNPDTIICDRALEKLVAFADQHSEAGAFGCRVLNPDGSFQLNDVRAGSYGITVCCDGFVTLEGTLQLDKRAMPTRLGLVTRLDW